MTSPMADTYNFHYPMEITTDGADVYCRAEGSNEFLQMVFRKADDIPDNDKQNWIGPYRAPDPNGPIFVRFDVTLI